MRRVKLSLAETIRQNQQAERNMAKAFEGICEPKREPPAVKPAVFRSARDRVAAPKLPSEADIRKAIMGLLKHHPKVHKAWTQASGTFQFEGANGSKRFFRANSARGMSDIQAILKGSGRSVFIEVKTEKGRVMEHQQEFLLSMRQAGALAFIARDVDTVLAELDRA